MARKTWMDRLQSIFKYYKSSDDIKPDDFEAALKKAGMDDDILTSFAELTPEQQNKFIKDLWNLVHPKELADDPEQRSKLYASLGERYETYFGWEEPTTPGQEPNQGGPQPPQPPGGGG